MTYALPFTVVLGAGMAGLTDLRAQILDTSGASVGAAISTGFVDIASGNYIWYYDLFPDNFIGIVKFYRAAVPAVTLTSAPVDPCCSAPSSSAYKFDYIVTNHNTGAPIEGAEIWITSDLAGAYTIWYGWSDSFGYARDVNGNKPFLAPGTYYVWVRLNGYITDAWPDTEVQP